MTRDYKAIALKAAAKRVGLSVEEYLNVPAGSKRCSKSKQIFPATPQYFMETKRGLRAECDTCRRAKKREHYQKNQSVIRAIQSDYRKENLEKLRISNAQWRAKFWPSLRAELIAAYGGKCACCGESEVLFLDLDHINNDGRECRKQAGNGQREMLALKRAGWPKGKHQLLCCNCNQGKARNGGICPHKTKSNQNQS